MLVGWFQFCRDVCVKILISNNSTEGSRSRGNGCWWGEGADRQTNKTIFRIVEERSTETLVPIILNDVEGNTIIYTDSRKAGIR